MEVVSEPAPVKPPKRQFVDSFPESVANFYLACRKDDWKLSMAEMKEKKDKTRAIGVQVLSAMAVNIRKLIKIAQQTYGFEETLNLISKEWRLLEPAGTHHRKSKKFRTDLEEKALKTMDVLDVVTKEVYKKPHDGAFWIKGCEKMVDEMLELSLVGLRLAYDYLVYLSTVDLLIKDEMKRIGVIIRYFRKNFEDVFPPSKAEREVEKQKAVKRKAEKHRADEGKDRPKS